MPEGVGEQLADHSVEHHFKVVSEAFFTQVAVQPDDGVADDLQAVDEGFHGLLQISGDPIIRLNSNLGEKRFAYNLEVVLYRVICELLSNTLRHAGAHNVYIDLIADDKSITLKYIDDGIGFDVAKEEKKLSGLGYSNMKSRIKSLNGTFQVFSAPGEGIRVDIQISL